MRKIAIVGSGIAGLGCAYFLHPKFDISLYEQNDYVGGHILTVTVQEEDRVIPIDTGFMVYNEVTYPNLTRLFQELQVGTKPTSMSFSVQHVPTGLEYSGTSLNHLFGQRKNLWNARFIRMLRAVHRFNREAVETLKDARYESYTLEEYVREKGYGEDFLNLYLVPMSSAVWSAPPDRMLEFPALTLIRFFYHHGFLGLHTQHPWRTVQNGAKSYVERMTAPFRNKIRTKGKVAKVIREKSRVRLFLKDGAEESSDKIIFACHADQALEILADAGARERRLLGEFKYQYSRAILHTDDSIMPKTRRCWASWNYRIEKDSDGSVRPSTHYWMNSLQGVSERRNYFVSINDPGRVNPAAIQRTIEFEHPLFSLDAIAAQKELPALNEIGADKSAYFCGSYFKYGFHEDALTSALDLCRTILGEPIWG